jgi:hypothetical protein
MPLGLHVAGLVAVSQVWRGFGVFPLPSTPPPIFARLVPVEPLPESEEPTAPALSLPPPEPEMQPGPLPVPEPLTAPVPPSILESPPQRVEKPVLPPPPIKPIEEKKSLLPRCVRVLPVLRSLAGHLWLNSRSLGRYCRHPRRRRIPPQGTFRDQHQMCGRMKSLLSPLQGKKQESASSFIVGTWR